jgi:PAS domain S-box-containing protein
MKESNPSMINLGFGLAALTFGILSAIFHQSTVELAKTGAETWKLNVIFGIIGGLGLAIVAALFVLICREINRYKQTVAELQRSGSFMQSIVDNIPYMIFVKEAKELRYVLLNKEGESLLGYSREDLTGKNDYSFFLKEEANFFTAKDRKVFEEKRRVDIPAEPIHTRYKGIRILHTTKVPVYDEFGTALYLLGISDDITEKR